MAFNRRTITKELDIANLQKHNDNYADIKTELDAHDTHVAAQTAHGSTADATPGKIVQRDEAGRAKVAAPAAADDIARKAEVDAVQGALDDHIDDAYVHLSGADRDKLDGIEPGAQPNQNAFAQINNVVAASETDTLTITGGTGIAISTNPTTKTVTVTATGTATPGAHGSSHNADGSDPIPDLVALKKQVNRVDLTANLGPSTSVINADQACDLDVTVYGSTLVNLLGADGNFEPDINGDGIADGWSKLTTQPSFTLESTNSKYGIKAQRISALATDTNDKRATRRSLEVKAGRFYVFLVDLVTDGSTRGTLRIYYANGTKNVFDESTTSRVLKVKLQPSVDEIIRVDINNTASAGSTGWVQFDGAGVYEIPESLYNRIGVDINESNIRDYLPHVDGRQHVQGVLITKSDTYEPQRLILPVTLASTPDGSVRDTAYYRDGAWRLMKRVDTSVDPAVALATPVESVISKAEGAITLHPGGNQISVETGVIQREKVTFDPSTKRGTTSKRSARIIAVYKGADPEPFTTYTSGSQTLPQLVNAVDSAASYYVTYITLDKYAYTTNVTQVDAKYTAGLSGSVSGALRDVARLQTQNDRQDFADDYIEAKVDNLRVDVDAHLADLSSQAAGKGASLIGVEDAGGHFTGTTVEAVLAELFTFANNGKSDIASVVGSPATGAETFAQLKAHIQDDKSTLATNLTAKGQTSTGAETLAALVAKVANVSTGKKSATGTAPMNAVNVTGLSFRPSIIVVLLEGSSNDFGGLYVATNSYGNTGSMNINFYRSNNAFSQNPFTVTSNGFTMSWTLTTGSATFKWIAFE